MSFEKRKEYEEYSLFLQNVRTNNFTFPLVGSQRAYVSFILNEVRETLKSYIPSIQERGPEGFYNRCSREVVTLKEKLAALEQKLRRRYPDQANKYYVSTKIAGVNNVLSNVNTIFPQLAKDSGDKETIQRCEMESGRLAALKLEFERLQDSNKEKFSFSEQRSRIDGIMHKLQCDTLSDPDLSSKQLQIASLKDELEQREIQEEIERLESNLVMYEMYEIVGSISNKHMKYCLFQTKRLEHILLHLLCNKTEDEFSFCVITTTSQEFEGREFFEKVTAPAVIRVEDTNQIIIYGTDLHKKELITHLFQAEFNKLLPNFSFTSGLSVAVDREVIKVMVENHFHSLNYFLTEEDYHDISETMSVIEEALKELDEEEQGDLSKDVEQDNAETIIHEQEEVLLQETSKPLELLERTSVSFNLGELPANPTHQDFSQGGILTSVEQPPPDALVKGMVWQLQDGNMGFAVQYGLADSKNISTFYGKIPRNPGAIREFAGHLGHQVNQYLAENPMTAQIIERLGKAASFTTRAAMYTATKLTNGDVNQTMQQVSDFEGGIVELGQLAIRRYNLTPDEFTGFTVMSGIGGLASPFVVGPTLRATTRSTVVLGNFALQGASKAITPLYQAGNQVARRAATLTREYSPIIFQFETGRALQFNCGFPIDSVKFRVPPALKKEIKLNIFDRNVGPVNTATGTTSQLALRDKLSILQNAPKTAAKVESLPDGRIRYYKIEKPPRKPGPTRGTSYVTEYNPSNGQVRTWMESYNHNGQVVRVHPKTIDGRQVESLHYPLTGKEIDKLRGPN